MLIDSVVVFELVVVGVVLTLHSCYSYCLQFGITGTPYSHNRNATRERNANTKELERLKIDVIK